MASDIYIGIPVKIETRNRLAKHKITVGEDWDDLVNRLLDELEAKRG